MGQQRIQWWKNAVFHVESVGKQTLFRDRLDYRVFLRLMALAQHQVSYRLHAYSLMPTNFHMMVSTDHADLSPLIAWIQRKYTDYYRNRYECPGQLFVKKQHKSLLRHRIDLLEASQRIHLIPVTEQLVRHPVDYPWSSYAQYVGKVTTDKPSDLRLYTHRVLQSFEGQASFDEKSILYKQFIERQLPTTNGRSAVGNEKGLSQFGAKPLLARKDVPNVLHTIKAKQFTSTANV